MERGGAFPLLNILPKCDCRKILVRRRGFRVRKKAVVPSGAGSKSQEILYPSKFYGLEYLEEENVLRSINNVYLNGVRIAALNEEGTTAYFLTDQVDSVAHILDEGGHTLSRMQYEPYGETLVQRGTQDFAPKYNSQELDRETSFYFYNARYYDPQIARFTSADTIIDGARSTQGWNRFSYVAGNPIRFKDPTGHFVRGSFDKTNGTLKIVDIDHYKEGLPVKEVSASEYVFGGIRDKKGNLTHNQVLVMKKVFSGGFSDANGNISRDSKNDPEQKPIPNGVYDLVEYETNKNTKWYKLDPADSYRYDDYHQGHLNSNGETRSGYRFHLGSLSHGCITVCDPLKERRGEWEVVNKILNNTSKVKVPKREGRKKYVPFLSRDWYGTIEVVGEDNIQEVKEE
ncbi:hypothetical protein CH371_15575 [Leptospira wolffii]|uniref:Teneurin-like YD-shell domain-containing protein n=1 Tax=Leptospira wolffii TaxID=409998 RepID=A0A2M9Z917_9LEPT|nr:hypothetical protein CH371_15575 [Leptospira wolffii]